MVNRHRGAAQTLTRGLFAAASLSWLVVAVLIATRSFDLGPVDARVVNLLAGAMFVAALLMGLLGWRVLRGSRLIDAIALVVAIANVAVTFTDDIGAYDIAYLVMSLALLVSLTVALVSSAKRAADA